MEIDYAPDNHKKTLSVTENGGLELIRSGAAIGAFATHVALLRLFDSCLFAVPASSFCARPTTHKPNMKR